MSYGNTNKDGQGNALWLLVDSEGRQVLVGAADHDASAIGNPVRVAGVYHAGDPAVTDGDIVDLKLDPAGRLETRHGWTPTTKGNAGATTDTGNDVEFTVVEDTEWKLKSIYTEFVTDATVGTRQVELQVQDDVGNVLLRMTVGATQVASQTRSYQLAPGLPDLTGFRDTDLLTMPIPDLVLPTDYLIKVHDNKGISGSDDLTIFLFVESRAVPA